MAKQGEEKNYFTSKSWSLVLTCEWAECNVTCEDMSFFVTHVRSHIDDVAAMVDRTSEKRGGVVCQWCDCMHHIEGGMLEFTRHLYFHAFHIKLKSIGMSFIAKGKYNTCMLDASTRNIVPDLPDRFHCGWRDCELVSDNPEEYYEHVRMHATEYPVGKNVKGGCRCLWGGCENTSKSRYRLQDHLRSHSQEKVIACPTCGNLFCSNTKFRDHLLKQDESLRTFQCSHCCKCFVNETLLRDHMRKHVSNYKCPFCEMTVTAPSQLRMHIKYRHTDDREFVCKSCNKGFKTERDIERHERSKHMSTTYLFCPNDDCDFKCKHQFQLTHHIKTAHEGREARYVCHICKSEYKRGRTLTCHLMKNHGFRWMPGHRKFKYNLTEDGTYRLQTVRYESYELSQQMQEEGYRKALAGFNSDVLKKLETTRQKSAKSSARQEADKFDSSSEDNDSEGEPLDLSARHRANTQEGYDSDGPCDVSRVSKASTQSAQTAARNSEEMYNLEMLGDVALNSSDEYASPRRHLTRSARNRADECVFPQKTSTPANRRTRSSRKSLEDTISALRNSPTKKRPPATSDVSESEHAVTSSQQSSSSARHRKRKMAVVKRTPAKKRLRADNNGSEDADGESVSPSSRPVSQPVLVFAKDDQADSNQSLPNHGANDSNQNKCKLVTEDGKMIVVETNVPSAIIGLSNMLESGLDYDSLPPGAQVIACGDDTTTTKAHDGPV